MLKLQFRYVEDISPFIGLVNNRGFNLFIGNDEETAIKTDLLYWDAPFLFPPIEEEGVRLATIEDIAAMKLDTISRGGRKKDFWDLSEILETNKISDLLEIYKKKYPWFEVEDVLKGLSDFTIADQMPDPICYKKKDWEEIKDELRRLTI
ncbi:hypothetical protein DXN04_08565 [Chitinophaga silvisoli]|uniref:Uncharacterized protein n=1 Tax=Chitinophaga silvisoli TaxID=2291814 RepID=A0A3E1P5H7_9BACT|nr:nucleotidyl transferase AbiEii/AbiGii toxin family protein [Chitinophaga silvisoli]RFM35432.1 hypothetical protein DXN04_08565 [Chitinophaga silvisoli]